MLGHLISLEDLIKSVVGAAQGIGLEERSSKCHIKLRGIGATIGSAQCGPDARPTSVDALCGE